MINSVEFVCSIAGVLTLAAYMFVVCCCLGYWISECKDASEGTKTVMLICAMIWPIGLPIYLGLRLGVWLAGVRWKDD